MNMMPFKIMPAPGRDVEIRIEQDAENIYVYAANQLKGRFPKVPPPSPTKTQEEEKTSEPVCSHSFFEIFSAILLGVSYIALLVAAIIT